MDSVSPDELLARAQGGDAAALGQLLETYRDQLRQMAQAQLDSQVRVRDDQYARNGQRVPGTRPVAQKKPNSFGVFDMHGNVHNWCQDWHADANYTRSEKLNPNGPLTPTKGNRGHVLRGGVFGLGPELVRSAFRWSAGTSTGSFCVGFRVVISDLTSNPKSPDEEPVIAPVPMLN